MDNGAGSTPLTYSDYVFDRLRADIVNGAIAPRAKLAMKDLMARYQVGLSPVREALHRLVGEGFVHTVGQRGFTVPALSLDDLEDLIALRTLVEEAAVRQALERGGDAWEARIVAAFHRLELQIGRFGSADDDGIAQFEVVHRGFHTAMYQGVVSPRLASLQANLFDQAFRYRKTLHREPLLPQEVLREHRHLMEVLLSRDADAAVAVICKHLTLTRASTEHFLAGKD
ncbi:GntR family transcriptional regulator [Aquabacterium sp. J223]|uniref:GntR family transcriptional regulator n=1 Tax=Aquabacterium sp. J223 TaxID=2898431 RepID=UPI0021ADDB05|nr:FCD domain-containing protein [Aquabacterium sp. J223]UUX94001.1 FCD domain-containing protein [Aquabacterium sp. J223]